MDKISHLYDELLLKILSLLPAKDVVDTMVLSKRWQFLWKFVPKLLYDDSYQNIEYGRFTRFVERSLALRECPVIETLHFKLSRTCGTQDIGVWMKTTDKSCVHELIIEIDSKKSDPVTLPKSLYTCYKKLVTLKLSNAILLMDDVNSQISFQSLKKLSLTLIKFPSDEFFNRLLSSCPLLEDFVVEQHRNDNVPVMSVRVPSLKRLVLQRIEWKGKNNTDHGFVINAPSLEHLDVFHSSGYCVIQNNMTKIVSANLGVKDWHDLMKFNTSLTSAKRLYLCVPTSNDAYLDGTVFNSLVHLKICTCETEWLNLFLRVLKDSRNLRVLKLAQCHYLRLGQPRPSWNQPSSVPECLVSSLETFEWVDYDGTQEEKEVAAFILRSTSCLKKATIIPSKSIASDKKLEMTKELSLMARRSAACPLAFS